MQILTTVIAQPGSVRALTDIRQSLTVEEGFLLILCPSQIDDVLSHARRFDPCVLIVSRALVDEAGVRFYDLVRGGRSIKIVVTVDDNESPKLDYLLLMGCWGIVSSDADLNVIRRMLRSLELEEMWASRRMISRVTQRLLFSQQSPALTDREIEVLNYLKLGLKNREIAERLFISPETLRSHLRNLYSKTGIDDRKKLFAYACERLPSPARLPAPRRTVLQRNGTSG